MLEMVKITPKILTHKPTDFQSQLACEKLYFPNALKLAKISSHLEVFRYAKYSFIISYKCQLALEA